jgi:ribosomal protein S21
MEGTEMKRSNVKVTARECRGNVERMIRRFIKKTKKEKIIDAVRDREYYRKPSDIKRAKLRKAKRLHQKELQKQQDASRKNK